MSDLKRVNVAVDPATREAIDRFAARESVSITEAVRRLSLAGDALYRHLRVRGGRVMVVRDGEAREVDLI